MNLFTQDKLQEDFNNYIKDNLHVWRAFEQKALNMARFRKHYGAQTIVEVIRYNTDLKEHGGTFKINNNNVGMFARMFEKLHPEHAGFFRMRKCKYDV